MAEGRRAKQLTSCGWAAERSGKKRSQRLTLPTSLHFHSAPPPTSLSQLFLNFFFKKKWFNSMYLYVGACAHKQAPVGRGWIP